MCIHAKAEAGCSCRHHNRTALFENMCRWVMNSVEGHCKSKSMAHAIRLLHTNARVVKTQAHLH